MPIWEEFPWLLREKNLDEKEVVGRLAGGCTKV